MTQSTVLGSETLALIASRIKAGVTGLELDQYANELIQDHGAIPTFHHYGGYPFHICISVNQAIVHGLPKRDPLHEGDLVSIDVGVLKNEFHSDQAYTFIVGEVSAEIQRLVKVTKTALTRRVQQARQGNRVGDIGAAIQSHVAPMGTVAYEIWSGIVSAGTYMRSRILQISDERDRANG